MDDTSILNLDNITIYNDTKYNDTIYNITTTEVPRENSDLITVYILIIIMCFIPFCCVVRIIFECIHSNITKYKENLKTKNITKNKIKTCIENSIFEINLNDLTDQNCAICLDKLEKNIGMLECKHSFHTDCVKPWIEEKLMNSGISTCPICRQTISTINTNIKIKYYSNSYNSDDSDSSNEY